MLLGIDVSHHTRPRNWWSFADNGIGFAFVWVTERLTLKGGLLDKHSLLFATSGAHRQREKGAHT